MRTPSWITQHWAALRALLVLTVLLGIVYPLVITGVAQIPGLQHKADGSLVKVGDNDGRQFADRAVVRSTTRATRCRSTSSPGRRRPATATTRPRPARRTSGRRTSSTSCRTRRTRTTPARRACSPRSARRSLAVGQLEGVAGARPFCTADGVGAVLVVVRAGGHPDGKITAVYSVNQACPATPFIATYQGVTVQCAQFGTDYTKLGFDHPDPRRRPGQPGSARRRRHRQRQRSRPADQPRLRRPAGAADREGTRHRPVDRSTV